MHPEINSVFWHINSVRLNDSGIYWASQVRKEGLAKKSNRVEVKIREVNANGTGKQNWRYHGPKMLCVIFFFYNSFILNVTVHPGLGNNAKTGDRGKMKESTNTEIAAVLVISTVVLVAAILPILIWRLYGVKGKFDMSYSPYKIYAVYLFHLTSFRSFLITCA